MSNELVSKGHSKLTLAGAKLMLDAAEQKAKEAGDELAKRQAEKAAEFFKQMQEQGVVD